MNLMDKWRIKFKQMELLKRRRNKTTEDYNIRNKEKS